MFIHRGNEHRQLPSGETWGIPCPEATQLFILDIFVEFQLHRSDLPENGNGEFYRFLVTFSELHHVTPLSLKHNDNPPLLLHLFTIWSILRCIRGKLRPFWVTNGKQSIMVLFRERTEVDATVKRNCDKPNKKSPVRVYIIHFWWNWGLVVVIQPIKPMETCCQRW